MVVSGVPEVMAVEERHAVEVTLAALEMLDKVRLFKVAHKPG